MTFTYRNLDNARVNTTKLGSWNGRGVYAARKRDLEAKGSGVYFCVYDDGNKMVTRIDGDWWVYGTLNESGTVSEYGRPERYFGAETQSENVKRSQPKTTYEVVKRSQTTAKPSMSFGSETSVDDVLKRARDMTVADLLEGFDYGLDVAKN